MKGQSAQTGKRGEDWAAEHYRADGYQLRSRNYRCRQGEIDLIVERDGMLVFVEVKTRALNAIDCPAAWVTLSKQHRIIKAAQHYLSGRYTSEPFTRFDVVEVWIRPDGGAELNRIENAFML